MFGLAVGAVLIGLGLAGIRYAPAIVEAQHRQGMTPYGDGPIEDDDRVSVTKAVGAVVAVAGLLVLASSAGVL
ncbi:hypothetical protein AB7C87_02350 [Natrarchaeobius sp. A-rgal3]|uniref:hypothetical protein n=1 Tax=Natrarchaeobius versutus TaxID=1679078 RepID=UPI0035105E15